MHNLLRASMLLFISGCSDGGLLKDNADTNRPEDTHVTSPSDSDASSRPRAIDELLSSWFRDYNAGLGTDYLTAPHHTVPAGDSRYPDIAHTFHQDVPYGPHARNVLDLWIPDAAEPAGIAVYIHGGGFISGGKDNVHSSQAVARLLQAGISVASIEYRWAFRDPALAVEATVPDSPGNMHDVDGTRLDYILRDCARAIQYIRYRADELHIDPERIGAWGPSAGGGCTVWTGTVDDLAEPQHPDPVLRESSRLTVMVHQNGQPTYNWLAWPELLDMDPALVFAATEGEATRLLQMPLDAQESSVLGRELSSILDYHALIGPGDPPLFTMNPSPDVLAEDAEPDQIVHHPRAARALYQRCVDQGLRCEIQGSLETTDYQGGMLGFLEEFLGPDAAR